MSAHTQTISHPTATAPMLPYPFLSQPPLPKQKKRLVPSPAPTHALPIPPVKQCTISSWAQRVQPGSPAPPSLSGTSISSFHIHVASPAHLHTDSPTRTATGTTPSIRDFKVDLASVGYASMFGPRSAGVVPMAIGDRTNIPTEEGPKGGKPVKRLASPSILRRARPRANTTSMLPSAPTPPSPSPAPARAQRKKQPSPYARPPLPAPLANDLLLLQFLDGGSLESHIARAQQQGVHRDAHGGVWCDADEELEYAPLLPAPRSASSSGWVKFGSGAESIISGEGEKRASANSALHARPLLPLDPSAYLPALPPTLRRNRTILAVGRGGARGRAGKPAYLVDVELAFPRTPTSPASSAPQSPASASASVRRRRSCSRSVRGKGRRPAPLDLGVDARRGFLGTAFAPAPSPVRRPVERQMSEDSDATITMAGAGALWEKEHAAEKKPGKVVGVMKFFKRG